MKKRAYPNIGWRDGVAQLEVIVQGKRHRESLHTSNFHEAVERRDTRIAELKAGVTEQSASWHTPGVRSAYSHVREFADADIERQREDGSSEHTIKCGLVIQWRRICQTFRTVDELTDDALATYYRNHRVAGLAHASIKRDLPLLRRASAWGVGRHPDLKLATYKVPKQSARVRHQRGVNAGEARTELPKLRAWLALLNTGARAQAEIVLRTGLRAFELRRLDAKWIKANVLELPGEATKGGLPRRIALTPPLTGYIKATLPLIDADYKKQFVRTGKEVYGDSVTLRDLRHTFASLASRHDADATRLIMGHTTGDRNASMFYQHATDERIVRVAKAIDAELGPLPAVG